MRALRYAGYIFTAALLAAPHLATASVERPSDILQRPWCAFESPHFRLTTDLSEDRALRLMTMLEQFDAVTRHVVRTEPQTQEQPLKVLVFADHADFSRVFNTESFSGFMRSSLHENMLILGPDEHGGHLTENALHEYAHHVLRSSGTAHYPLWYEEGYATFLASMTFTKGMAEVGGAGKFRRSKPHHLTDDRFGIVVRRVYNASNVKRKKRGSIQHLLRIESLAELSTGQVHEFYTNSWMLVHLLELGHHVGHPDRREALRAYITQMADGASHEAAYAANFDIEERDLNRALRRHRSRLALPTASYPIPDVALAEPPQALGCLETSDAAYEIGLATTDMNIDFSTDAFNYLSGLDDPRAPIGQALLTSIRGDHDEAALIATRAVAKDGDNALAKVLLAGAIVESCDDANSCRSEWHNAVNLYLDALYLDNRRADASFGLGVTYFLLGQIERSVSHLEAAHERAPWAPRISLFLGEAYRLVGHSELAKQHLQRAARWEADGHWRSKANKALQLLAGR